MSFAEKVFQFHKKLKYSGKPLPKGIRVMNPFEEYDHVLSVAKEFFFKYLDDDLERHIILGINPGRHGAGLTGIPFTDPKRISSECGINYKGKLAHEPSSVFIYEMINAYGGPEKFYKDFYINSPSPLGYTTLKKEKELNYNYYDSKELYTAVKPFMVDSLKKLIRLGIKTDKAFCLGTGKNFTYLKALNIEHAFFGEIIPLEHPRYIMQYKSRQKLEYIQKYLEVLGNVRRGT